MEHLAFFNFRDLLVDFVRITVKVSNHFSVSKFRNVALHDDFLSVVSSVGVLVKGHISELLELFSFSVIGVDSKVNLKVKRPVDVWPFLISIDLHLLRELAL